MNRPIHALAALALGLLLAAPVGDARAANGAMQAHGIGSDFLDRSRDEWGFGLGLGAAVSYRVSSHFDLRGDISARWYEGESREFSGADRTPRWGQKEGEVTDGLRAIPFTAELVYRFEDWSRGRYWLPYVGAGPGLYDLEARFVQSDGGVDDETTERTHNLFRAGWHVRGGVRFERTSGLYMLIESAVHSIDVPGRWTNLYDVGIGVGGFFPSH